MGEKCILQKLHSKSEQQTEQIAERLAATLKGTEIIAMFGGLGAGKTAFTRGLARGLGINDGVSSPTFALVHEYEVASFIGSYDDLYSTGFYDYQDQGIMIIEWSENIEEFLPEKRINIKIERISDNEREITIEGAEKL